MAILQKFGMNLVQGVAEGAFKYATGITPSTGQPTLGGVVGNAMVNILTMKYGSPPRSGRMTVDVLKSKGFTHSQSTNLVQKKYFEMDSSSIKIFQSNKIFSAKTSNFIQQQILKGKE